MTPAQYETIQSDQALRLKAEALPTLRDIYRDSFRLWALTFGPVIRALLRMLLWAYLPH